MIRASGAEDKELCGYIEVLQRRHRRTFRNTLIGTAGHAVWSVAADAKERLARLTDEERAELATMKKPADFRDEDRLGHVTLRYEDAHKEDPVGLDSDGCYMEVEQAPDDPAGYKDQPGLLVPSTVDMWWSYHHPRGKTVFVGDIKTGEHEIKNGARNLQFVAPAMALADREGAQWYRTGIWYAREGRWDLGPAVHVASEMAMKDLQRLQRAATNPPIPVIGGHCNECFQRQHCDAYVLPVSQAETALAPLTAADKLAACTPEELVQLHLKISGWKKMLDVAHDTMKAAIEARGPQRTADGSVLELQVRQGREYADTELVRLKLPEAIKRARPSKILAVRKA